MDRSKFERWIKNETSTAIRDRNIMRVRILLTWYELVFKEEFSSPEFDYPFYDQLMALHHLLTNGSWLDGLIDEELKTRNKVGDYLSVKRINASDEIVVDESFIICSQDILAYQNTHIPQSLSKIKEIVLKNDDPFIYIPERQIVFAQGMLKIETASNMITCLEDELKGFNRIILVSSSDFFRDLYFALTLSSIKSNIEILFLDILHGTAGWSSLNNYLDSFDERYNIGVNVENAIHSFTSKDKYSNKKYSYNLDNGIIDEMIKNISSPVMRGLKDPATNGILNHNYQKSLNASNTEIGLANENAIKEKLKFTSQSLIEKLAIDLLALNKGAYVLLMGETGVGKSHIAHALHQLSERKEQRFVKVNCATLQENLLASELFGAVPGAYTGVAKDGMKGKIEEADGGTLFLDEIFEAHPSIQTQLLTFLDDNTYMKVGGHQPLTSNIRIIFATNRTLTELTSGNDFREDFFQRISSFQTVIPPLRDRPEDLINMFDYCLDQIIKQFNYIRVSVPNDTINLIKELRWSGNSRQLIKTVEKIVITCIHKGLSIITPDIVLNSYQDFKQSSDFENLEKILEDYFVLWQKEKSNLINFIEREGGKEESDKTLNYIDGFLKPIVAHFFLEKHDKDYGRKDTFKVIGMNAERQESYLALKAGFYPIIKKYFSKK